MKFWSEAKYNFAFFDQLPELDWEEKLLEYLSLVERDQSNREYYRLLEQLAATLQDGHTNVYLPYYISSQYGRPKVALKPVGSEVVVTNVDVDLVDSLPIGSTVLRVDDIPVEKYLTDSIYPYVAAGGAHTRRMIGVRELLKGLQGNQVSVELRLPDGDSVTRTLLRQPSDRGNWVRDNQPPPPASFRMVEPDIGYLALNTFSDGSVVDTFQVHRPQISRCAGLIIDLRENGGGNSAYGYQILRYFTRQPLRTPVWSSPEHIPAYRAFGQWYSKQANVDTTEIMVRESLTAYAGERYYRSTGDSIMPADTVYDIPVLVLVSTYTASSAENFLVTADPLEHFTFVGEPSFGSTGQPLFLDLPGGGRARICTKRNTYPDGRDYVGPG
ncbi:MAG: S41 family peptidase, partial [Bacteroidota bacterium]